MATNFRVGLFGMMLAAAGIPLYIHLPRFAAEELGISLAAVGTILLAIRLVDLIQDPFLGWMIDRWPSAQAGFALMAVIGLAAGFPLLFLLTPETAVTARLVAILLLLFSAYSLGSILLYGRSAALAGAAAEGLLVSQAAWREAGMLAGVLIATMAPAAFVALGAGMNGYPAFGVFLGALSVAVGLLTMPLWRSRATAGQRISLAGLVRSGAARLILIALVNSLPVAITSTLFLFFVEDRLGLERLAGPFLVLFFFASGLSVPFWNRVAHRIGPRQTLLLSMPLAIAGFVGAAVLAAGNGVGFALICVASGAAIGADLVLLPAMFSVAMTRAGMNAAEGFGVWFFAGKLGLALSAFVMLWILDASGFRAGEANSQAALTTLTLCYAVVPCVLKIGALYLVFRLPKAEVAA